MAYLVTPVKLPLEKLLACCAFAVLIVSQLLFPIRRLFQRMGYGANFIPDQSVMWSPQAAGHLPTPPAKKPSSFSKIFALPNFSKRTFLLVGGLELALVAGFFFSWDSLNTPANGTQFDSNNSGPMTMAEIEAVIHGSICGQLKQDQT